MHREMAVLWSRLGDAISAGREAAAAAAVEGMMNVDLLKTVLPARDLNLLRRSLERSAVQNLEVAESRVLLSKIPLAESVYRNEALSSGKIDRIVDDALSRGASAAELARDVRAFVNPNTRGGVRYAAQRLGRTELNNAFHATQVRQAQQQPWVTAVKWELSGSHPVPDECNEYAEGVFYAGGKPGEWKPEDVPAKPHPNCLCFTTPVDIGREAFVDGLLKGDFDAYLEKEGGLELEPVKASVSKATPAKAAAPPAPTVAPADVVHKVGTPGFRKALDSAERSRASLVKSRYNRAGQLNDAKGWTRSSEQAHEHYAGSGYEAMNMLKRDPEKATKLFKASPRGDELLRRLVQWNSDLERLIRSNSVRADITVVRGVEHDLSHLSVGDHLADPGFLSTTTKLERANDFSVGTGSGGPPGWNYVIQVPKGTKAISGNESENEIVFLPGQRQVVTSIDARSRTIYTRMEN
jgi:hypothetical protein